MQDPTFASKVLGQGIVVEPDDPYVYAPSDEKELFIYPTKHVIGFVCNNGIPSLIHIA